MLKRKVYDYLQKWKNDENKKPLLIYGQRQIGKTFIIKEFAKNNYANFFYMDFSNDEELCDIFKKYSSVDEIILSINAQKSVNIEVKKTLLIFDEIQDCEDAISSLKQFAIDGNYDVIATGSMLGIMIDYPDGKPPLSPMGYVEPYMMRPFDFEEFLWSQGVSEKTIGCVREQIRKQEPLHDPILKKIHSLFKLYMIVGGMPESINAFNADKRTFKNSGIKLDGIISQINRDINRYNHSKPDRNKTTECFDSIPAQLAQTNKKFQYSRITNDIGSRKASNIYKDNLLWIRDAGYGLYVYSVNDISSPIIGQINRDIFKIYLSDTGMLTHMYGDPAVAAIYTDNLKYNFGAITENVVAVSLVNCGYKPTYYQKRAGIGRMEIDFIIETFDGLVAIEVKSGKTRDTPSLDKIDEHFDVQKKIILEEGNISIDEKGTMHLPLFASAFLNEIDHVPEFMK